MTWVTLMTYRNIKWHEVLCGLSATAEPLVQFCWITRLSYAIIECRWGFQKLRFSTNSSLFNNDCSCVNNSCDRPPCSLPHTPPHISESLFITTGMDDHDEQSRISGKYEAEVSNNRRLCSTYCTIEANCWQTRSIARPLCNSRATCRLCSCL